MEEVIEVEKKSWKMFFSFIFIMAVLALLTIYWFIPFNTINFGTGNTNFSIDTNTDRGIQFYPKMRFPNSNVSYKIEDCTLQKKDDMKRAFEIISNQTNLNFYSVSSNEEIIVTCDSRNKIQGIMFIAGEGGPTNITQTTNFNVILGGQILLIKDSNCPNPNVAIHELLHVLGFGHSSNQNNIMYNISKCRQNIGQDITELINQLYSAPTYADLSLENVSAVMHGKYLDANMTFRNNGLLNSPATVLNIYADEKLVREIELEELEIGYGRTLSLTNVWISKINIEQLKFKIESNFSELNKNNNEIILQLKK